MQEVFTKWRASIFSPVTLVMLVSAFLLTTLSGPFGTHAALELLPRAAFWGVSLTIALLMGTFIHQLFRVRMPEEKKNEAEIVSSAVFAIFFGAVMLGWVSIFADLLPVGGFQVSWWQIFLEVAIITVTLLAIRIYLVRGLNKAAAEVAAPEPKGGSVVVFPKQDEPRLMRRLKDDEKAKILWLTSEDHFVEIHTDAGCVRIRMRLTDAIDEMEGVEGSCVHRSHWVAYAAIKATEKVGGYWRLHLSSGETVPVSRKYQPLLEEAGILERLAIA